MEILTLFLEAALADKQWLAARRWAWQLYLSQLPPGTTVPRSWSMARRRLQEIGGYPSLPPAAGLAVARALSHHSNLEQEQEQLRVAVDLCLANVHRRPTDPAARRVYQASLLMLKFLLPRLSHFADLQELVWRLPGIREKSPEYQATVAYFTGGLGRQGGKLQYLIHTLEDRAENYPVRRPGDLLYLAALAMELQDLRTAREYFDRLARLLPDDQRVAALRLQALAAGQDSSRLLQALDEQPQTPARALEMAKIYLDRQQYDGVLTVIGGVPRSHQLWPQAQLLAIQAYRGLQQYPAALAAIRELQATGRHDSSLAMAEAQVLEAMDDRAGAVAAYQAVIHQAPDAFTRQVAQARLARFRRDWAGAYRHFALALQEQPQNVEILNELEQVREQQRPTLAARNLPEFWRGERRPEEGLRPWQFGRYDRDPAVLGGSRGSSRSLLPVRLPYVLTPETTILRDSNRLKALETRLAGGLWLSRVLPVHLSLGYRVWQQHTSGPGPANLDLGLKPVFQQTSSNRTTWERGEATLTLGPLVLGARFKVTGEISGRRYWRQLKQQVTQYGQKVIPLPPIINTPASAGLTEQEVRNRLVGSVAVELAAGAQTDLTLRYARRDIFDQDPGAYPRLFQQVIRLDTLPLLTFQQVEMAVAHQFFPGLSYQGNLGQAFFSDRNQRLSLYQGLRWQAVHQPRMHLDLTPSYYLALYRWRQEAYFSPHHYQALGLSLDFDRQLPQAPIISRFLLLLPTLVLQVTGQVVDNDGRWGPALATLAGLEAEPIQNLYLGIHYFFFKEWVTNYWFKSLSGGLTWRF
ncbi:MAG: tetratricopeptide repeat protein [Desulfobacca sp.]|uniref:tetratricopeptide repeat protein n=1 Tax=Desulfobacca sp. TaxID=2067990 RepID=UPI00404A93C2